MHGGFILKRAHTRTHKQTKTFLLNNNTDVNMMRLSYTCLHTVRLQYLHHNIVCKWYCEILNINDNWFILAADVTQLCFSVSWPYIAFHPLIFFSPPSLSVFSSFRLQISTSTQIHYIYYRISAGGNTLTVAPSILSSEEILLCVQGQYWTMSHWRIGIIKSVCYHLTTHKCFVIHTNIEFFLLHLINFWVFICTKSINIVKGFSNV